MENTMDLNGAVNAESREQTLIGGIITGQIAGLIMAVVVMIVFAVFLGKSPLYQCR